jgi:hypothetical protein
MIPSKWRKYSALSGAGLAAAAVGFALVSPVGTGPLGQSGGDLLSLMKSRSPGERTDAATSSKARVSAPMAAAAPTPTGRPVSRVLSAAAPAAAAAPVLMAAPPAAIAAPAAIAPVAPAMGGAPILAAVPVASAGFPPALGLVGALPLIPAIMDEGPTGGDLVVSPGPAVPEPATWLMMITGFGILGTVLRRRRRLLASQRRVGGSAPACTEAA